MIVGFTGTQRGMSAKQRIRLKSELYMIQQQHRDIEFHMGDCLGADMQAADIAKYLGYKIISHPPTNPSKRCWYEADQELPARPYLDRNHDIVNVSEVMFAAPNEDNEVLRSGTWATIRYARKQRRPIYVIYREGFIWSLI